MDLVSLVVLPVEFVRNNDQTLAKQTMVRHGGLFPDSRAFSQIPDIAKI
jgi:hypothetical protein